MCTQLRELKQCGMDKIAWVVKQLKGFKTGFSWLKADVLIGAPLVACDCNSLWFDGRQVNYGRGWSPHHVVADHFNDIMLVNIQASECLTQGQQVNVDFLKVAIMHSTTCHFITLQHSTWILRFDWLKKIMWPQEIYRLFQRIWQKLKWKHKLYRIFNIPYTTF